MRSNCRHRTFTSQDQSKFDFCHSEFTSGIAALLPLLLLVTSQSNTINIADDEIHHVRENISRRPSRRYARYLLGNLGFYCLLLHRTGVLSLCEPHQDSALLCDVSLHFLAIILLLSLLIQLRLECKPTPR